MLHNKRAAEAWMTYPKVRIEDMDRMRSVQTILLTLSKSFDITLKQSAAFKTPCEILRPKLQSKFNAGRLNGKHITYCRVCDENDIVISA